MPKNGKIVSRFDGGKNTKSNAKDVAENELVEAKNVFVDQIGTLKSGGKAELNSGSGKDYAAQSIQNPTAGYGFYEATMDYKENDSNTTNVKTIMTAPQTGGMTMVVYDAEDGGSFSDSNITVTGGGSQKPIYHKAGGAVRICDANLENNSTSKVRWYGFVKRTHFNGLTMSGVTNVYNEYFAKDNDMAAPTFIDCSGLTNYPTTEGTGFSLSLTEESGGEWQAGDYDIGISFIYDGNQESLLKVETSAITLTGDDKTIKVAVGAHAPYNPRLSGGRAYIRKNDTDDSWVFLADISLRDGIRAQLDNIFTAWNNTYSSDKGYTGNIYSIKPNIDTFDSINGYSPDENSLSIGVTGEGYKTSVVTNSRTFVANIKAKNEDGEKVHMPDRIMYSQIGKYDIFPTSNYIDIGVNDGDEFIKLEAFADRLFAFKKNKLYVINISGGSDTQWFLESEYTALGVTSPNATVKVDLGIVWANENGLYLYDGKSVINLQKKIDDQEWFDFCTGTALMVGFLPRKKEIIIMEGCTNGSTDAYICHLPTQSFVYVENLFPSGYTFSNFILDSNGKLSAYGNGVIVFDSDGVYSYDGTQVDRDDADVTFKFDDFGDPMRLKKLYKILVNYTSTEDQEDPFKYVSIDNTGTITTETDLTGDISTSSTPKITEFTFSADGSPIIAQAAQLRFAPSTSSGQWQINDVTLIYRKLNKKAI